MRQDSTEVNFKRRKGLLQRAWIQAQLGLPHTLPEAHPICGTFIGERRLLYHLGLGTESNVLEEGPYVGCSTLALASGLRDQKREIHHQFFTCDAFPTGMRNTNSPTRFAKTEKGEIVLYVWDKPMYFWNDTQNLYSSFFVPVVEKDGGILHALYANLKKFELHSNVTIIAGGSQNYPRLDYHVVWSDAAHDLTEVKRNLHVWLGILSLSQGAVVFSFHDLGTDALTNVRNFVRQTLASKGAIVFEVIIDATWAIEVEKF